MDRTGTTFVEAPVNRDSVLQFILVMLFLHRSRDVCQDENPATFSFSPNDHLKMQGFPLRIESATTSDFA